MRTSTREWRPKAAQVKSAAVPKTRRGGAVSTASCDFSRLALQECIIAALNSSPFSFDSSSDELLAIVLRVVHDPGVSKILFYNLLDVLSELFQVVYCTSLLSRNQKYLNTSYVPEHIHILYLHKNNPAI
jgi:hypothetical protein